MKTEKEKMLAGELYDALDPQLAAERVKTRMLLKALNESPEYQLAEREKILNKLISKTVGSI